MKKQHVFFTILFGLLLFACDNESDSLKNKELTKWIFEIYEYDAGDTPTIRAEFTIDDGKINSFTSQYYSDGNPLGKSHTTLLYDGSKVVLAATYNRRGEFVRRAHYHYNDDGELAEYILEERATNGGIARFKMKFTYSENNTVVSSDPYYSADGIDYIFDSTSNHDIRVFDDEGNQVTYHSFKRDSSNGIYTDEYEFDSNNNLIYARNRDYTYSETPNPAGIIMMKTFGKKVFWLTPWIHKNFHTTPFLISENALTGLEDWNTSQLDTFQIDTEDGVLLSNRYVFTDEHYYNEIRNEFVYE